jgi:hypothetical protein
MAPIIPLPSAPTVKPKQQIVQGAFSRRAVTMPLDKTFGGLLWYATKVWGQWMVSATITSGVKRT